MTGVAAQAVWEQALDVLLDRRHQFPVTEDAANGIPKGSPAYQPITDLVAAGSYSVGLRRLLHAIGSKSYALPSSRQADCVFSAYGFLRTLNWRGAPPYFRHGLGDKLGSLSHDLGVGVTTLVVHDLYGVRWDELEAIPGKQKRCDFRAEVGGLRLLAEAKGTTSKYTQAGQVADGKAKKDQHRARGANFGVGLTVSTWIGTASAVGTGIVVGDPPFDEQDPLVFGPRADLMYRLRHYARLCHLVGATQLGMALYGASLRLWRGDQLRRWRAPDVPDLPFVESQGIRFFGRWIPPHPEERRFWQVADLPVGVFYGVSEFVLNLLKHGGFREIEPLPLSLSFETDQQGQRLSVLPDGSMMQVRATGDFRPVLRHEPHGRGGDPSSDFSEETRAMNEAETRRNLIDEKLSLAGWSVQDPSHVTLELDIDLKAAGHLMVAEPKTAYGSHQFADYGLLLHGKPVAVVEAKRTSKDAELGQEQALTYAKNLQATYDGPQPFVMYTNGYDIFFWEADFYPPFKVHGFPTRDDLDWLDQRRGLRNPLSVELINTDIAGRGYQIEAIRSILELVEAKRRRFLLVMATGTGKTRTAVALIDVLRRAKWAKRILFLVDRIALRDQALDAFKDHIPNEARWPKHGETAFAKDRRLYVTTYPTMLNLIEAGTTPATRISPFFFDLIVADESHRSIYNMYKQVLDYFHAITLGLTATPTDHIDHDTFRLFECDKNDPTFAYTYEDAVEHKPPYLCDFEVLRVRSKFQIEGIKQGTIPPAVQKKLIAEGKDIGDIDFEGSDLERKVTNSGTNAIIVREFMEESIKDHTGTLPGKTIIFAISKGHARRLQKLFDAMYPEHAGKLARVLVSEDRFVYGKGGLLDQFKTENMPRVAISVDMLDTGVDVPEVVNLVFAKPVYSYTKFWQMIGRGTRILNDDLAKRKPWCTEKDRFLIIDCWGNFEFFQMRPKGREPGEQVPLPVRLFRARLDKLEAALAAGADIVAANIKLDLRADLATLPENNVVVSEAKAHLDAVAADQWWTTTTAEDLGFLRSVIAPVFRARSAADSKGMRFEIDAVEAGTALVSGNKEGLDAVKVSLVEQVAELPLTVNVVAKEQTLIEDFQTPTWWASVTDNKVREAVALLVPLMKYRQRKKDGMVHLDITDLVTVKEWIEFGPAHERLSTSAYRERVESFVRDLVKTTPALQKLQQGEELSGAEIKVLADLLAAQDPYVTEELLRKVYDHKTARFIRFLKHILGLEPLGSWEETVTAAFEGFIAEHNTFSGMQVRFLQTLKTFVLQTGRATKKDLIDAPFTQIHPKGVRGIFQPAEIDEILRFTEKLVA